jgi:hypothetical protein
MRHSHSVLTAAAALAFVLASGDARAQSRTADFQWRGAVAAGATLEIKGVNGNVAAQPASGGEAEVTAVRRGRRSDPESVRIEVLPHAGGVTICAVYPSPDGRRANECGVGEEGRMNTQNNDVNVHFTVRVPPGVRFVGKSVNGDVEAEQLSGPVVLSTVNGSANFSTSSYGEATTVNGSIKGDMGSADWPETLEFTSVNGGVTLNLPADVSTEVRASTVNGDISTDFPLTVTGRFSPRRMNGTIGGGGRRLEIETVNGSVHLRKR